MSRARRDSEGEAHFEPPPPPPPAIIINTVPRWTWTLSRAAVVISALSEQDQNTKTSLAFSACKEKKASDDTSIKRQCSTFYYAGTWAKQVIIEQKRDLLGSVVLSVMTGHSIMFGARLETTDEGVFLA